MSDELKDLIEKSRHVRMTPEEKERQRRSFAYGNAKIENDRITKELIDREAELLRRNER